MSIKRRTRERERKRERERERETHTHTDRPTKKGAKNNARCVKDGLKKRKSPLIMFPISTTRVFKILRRPETSNPFSPFILLFY